VLVPLTWTDYNVIRAGSEFLSLSQSVFTEFLPNKAATTVNALEVLLVLTMFSNSPTLDASLGFCFRLFDADNSDSIEVGTLVGHAAHDWW